MAQIDYSKVVYSIGNYYYPNGRVGGMLTFRKLTPKQITQYKAWKAAKDAGMEYVPPAEAKRRESAAALRQYKKQFNPGALKQKGGWIETLKTRGALFMDGKEIREGKYNFRTPKRMVNGKLRNALSQKYKWGTDRSIRPRGNRGAGYELDGGKSWAMQIQVAIHQLVISSEQFRMMLAERASHVFRLSFRMGKFNSSNARVWKPLSAFRRKIREMRGTGTKVLKEYGDLRDSIQIDNNYTGGGGGVETSVYTEPVKANAAHHKRHTLLYAGFHNEGVGTYGNGWGKKKPPQPYVKRQFMGHSSHLRPQDAFVSQMMKLYLFDNIFLMLQT